MATNVAAHGEDSGLVRLDVWVEADAVRALVAAPNRGLAIANGLEVREAYLQPDWFESRPDLAQQVIDERLRITVADRRLICRVTSVEYTGTHEGGQEDDHELAIEVIAEGAEERDAFVRSELKTVSVEFVLLRFLRTLVTLHDRPGDGIHSGTLSNLSPALTVDLPPIADQTAVADDAAASSSHSPADGALGTPVIVAEGGWWTGTPGRTGLQSIAIACGAFLVGAALLRLRGRSSR